MQHILTAEQFTTDDVSTIFESADTFRQTFETDRRKLTHTHLGAVAATLFYEPSTRTRLSFESAASRLGASVISTENAKDFSSNIKGETLEDSILTVAQYADVVVLRHSDDDSAERASAISPVPIINAGAGKNEHPTQALLDLYTIHRSKGQTHNLNITIGGDLHHGRTARSLAKLVALYPNNHITFVSDPALQIDKDITDYLDDHGTTYSKTHKIGKSLQEADVVYWTRLQKERLEDPSIASHFSIGQHELKHMYRDAIIMHPLPRNDEIHPSVDADPRAKYFEQVQNGLFVRMALLDQLLANS